MASASGEGNIMSGRQHHEQLASAQHKHGRGTAAAVAPAKEQRMLEECRGNRLCARNRAQGREIHDGVGM